MSHLRSLLRKIIASAPIIFCSPTFACILQGGMYIPIGIFAFLYFPWNPLVWLSETRWLVTHLIFIPYYLRWLKDVVETLSTVFVVVGLAIFLIAFWQLTKRKTEFLTTGLYSVVRHPQYLGIMLSTLGFTLRSWKPMAVIAWLTLAFGYLLLASSEEKRLQEKHGAKFLSYKQRVPFILPLLPPGPLNQLPSIMPKSRLKRHVFLLCIYLLMVILAAMILKPYVYGNFR